MVNKYRYQLPHRKYDRRLQVVTNARANILAFQMPRCPPLNHMIIGNTSNFYLARFICLLADQSVIGVSFATL